MNENFIQSGSLIDRAFEEMQNRFYVLNRTRQGLEHIIVDNILDKVAGNDEDFDKTLEIIVNKLISPPVTMLGKPFLIDEMYDERTLQNELAVQNILERCLNEKMLSNISKSSFEYTFKHIVYQNIVKSKELLKNYDLIKSTDDLKKLISSYSLEMDTLISIGLLPFVNEIKHKSDFVKRILKPSKEEISKEERAIIDSILTIFKSSSRLEQQALNSVIELFCNIVIENADFNQIYSEFLNREDLEKSSYNARELAQKLFIQEILKDKIELQSKNLNDEEREKESRVIVTNALINLDKRINEIENFEEGINLRNKIFNKRKELLTAYLFCKEEQEPNLFVKKENLTELSYLIYALKSALTKKNQDEIKDFVEELEKDEEKFSLTKNASRAVSQIFLDYSFDEEQLLKDKNKRSRAVVNGISMYLSFVEDVPDQYIANFNQVVSSYFLNAVKYDDDIFSAIKETNVVDEDLQNTLQQVTLSKEQKLNNEENEKQANENISSQDDVEKDIVENLEQEQLVLNNSGEMESVEEDSNQNIQEPSFSEPENLPKAEESISDLTEAHEVPFEGFSEKLEEQGQNEEQISNEEMQKEPLNDSMSGAHEVPFEGFSDDVEEINQITKMNVNNLSQQQEVKKGKVKKTHSRGVIILCEVLGFVLILLGAFFIYSQIVSGYSYSIYSAIVCLLFGGFIFVYSLFDGFSGKKAKKADQVGSEQNNLIKTDENENFGANFQVEQSQQEENSELELNSENISSSEISSNENFNESELLNIETQNLNADDIENKENLSNENAEVVEVESFDSSQTSFNEENVEIPEEITEVVEQVEDNQIEDVPEELVEEVPEEIPEEQDENLNQEDIEIPEEVN